MVPKLLTGDFALALHILAQSERHRGYTIADIERVIAPPIAYNQYYLWHWYAKGKGVKSGLFITWAFLSDEVERGLIDGTRKLQRRDWFSGRNVWVMDVATWGLGSSLLLPAFKQIRNRYPNVETVKFRRWYPGKERRIVEMRLSDALSERTATV